jgi:hypothetical protein
VIFTLLFVEILGRACKWQTGVTVTSNDVAIVDLKSRISDLETQRKLLSFFFTLALIIMYNKYYLPALLNGVWHAAVVDLTPGVWHAAVADLTP